MRYILTLVLTMCAYFSAFGADVKNKNADSKTACVFVAVDTLKRDAINNYVKGAETFVKSAYDSGACVRAIFAQNAFHKDKFIRYAEFANCADAKKFADEQSQKKKGIESEIFFFTITPDASKDTKLIIAVDFDEIPSERIEQFLKISKPLRNGTNTEKDTISYEIYSDPANRSKFFLFELYKNRDAHAFHAKQNHFIEWNKKCKDLKFGRKGKFLDVQ